MGPLKGRIVGLIVFKGVISMESPTWDQHLSHLASADHANALGRFVLAFNLLEMMLALFFRHYFPESEKIRSHLFGSLHNRARSDVISLCANANNNASEIELVEYAMKCFYLCVENRNLLLYSTPFIQMDDGHLIMGKQINQRPGRISSYKFDLYTIRRAATDTYSTYEFFLSVIRRLERVHSDDKLPSLPEKPPLPRKLSLSQYSISSEA